MNWRKVVFLFLVLAFGVFLLGHFAQGEALLRTLKRGQPLWIGVAIWLQLGTLANQTSFYQALYASLDLPIHWRDLWPNVLAGHFLNVVTPSAGLGGTALLMNDARLRGFDMGRAALANTLYFALNFVWFGVLLMLSLAFLSRRHELLPAESAAAATLFTVLALAAFALIFLAVRPRTFLRVLENAGQRINVMSQKMVHRALFPTTEIVHFIEGFGASVRQLQGSHTKLLRPILHAILVDSLEIAVLAACFQAFPAVIPHLHHHATAITLPLLVIGYSIGTLFLVVSVTPQGLGVVEGVMTAVFASLGVPIERAAVAVLAYRGLSFWMPLWIGFLALRWTTNSQPNLANLNEKPNQTPLP